MSIPQIEASQMHRGRYYRIVSETKKFSNDGYRFSHFDEDEAVMIDLFENVEGDSPSGWVHPEKRIKITEKVERNNFVYNKNSDDKNRFILTTRLVDETELASLVRVMKDGRDSTPALLDLVLNEIDPVYDAINRFSNEVWKKGFRKRIQVDTHGTFKGTLGDVYFLTLSSAGRIMVSFHRPGDYYLSLLGYDGEKDWDGIKFRGIYDYSDEAVKILDNFTNNWANVEIKQDTEISLG